MKNLKESFSIIWTQSKKVNLKYPIQFWFRHFNIHISPHTLAGVMLTVLSTRLLFLFGLAILSACSKAPDSKKFTAPAEPALYGRGESHVLCKFAIYAVLKDEETDVPYVRPLESDDYHIFTWNYQSSSIREPSGKKHEVSCRVDRANKKIDGFVIDDLKILWVTRVK